MGRLAQVQIIAGAIAALSYFAIRLKFLGSGLIGFAESLEALSFVLCSAAVITSSRQLRERYTSLGSEVQRARQTPEYMRLRQSYRMWSYFASLVIAALAAARFNVSTVIVLVVVAVAAPVIMALVDRATGWKGAAEA